MLHKILFVFILLSTEKNSVLSQEDYVEECPTQFGFFADAVQCDRYYECKDGEIFDRYCADGLVFDESSTAFAKCSFPFSVDCSDRPELQPPKPSKLCPRQNGYFPHENPEVCDKFYFCVDGVPNPITCPASLIFDPSLGQCAYSDQVKREGCSSVEVFKFECPKVKDARHEHPRYPDPNDCQYFYICIEGQARRNGCTIGQVFNKETLACDAQSNVNDAQCRNWYNETVLEGVTVRPRPGGVPINTVDRQRVVVRRRKPRPEQQLQQVSVSTSEAISSVRTGPVRAASGSRPTVPPTFGAARPRQQVRTRVRRPPAQAEEPQIVEEGPPRFALDSDEAIQRFRESNPFGPQSDDGRLTVLNGQPQDVPRRQPVATANPIRSFAAVPAVPEPLPEEPVQEEPVPTFGSRFKSRRPPSIARPAFQPQEAVSPSPAPRRPPPRPSNFDNFEPLRSEAPSTGGRQRLEVTEIRVRPQLNRDFDEEPLDIEAFRQVANRFRQRGSQQ